MTDKLKQTIKDEVAKLPTEIQRAINSFDWVGEVERVGKDFSLSDVDIHNLQVETLLVLVGLEDGELYALNIEDEVGTSRAEAEKIAKRALEGVFLPIRDILNENIKGGMKSKDANWEQNMNFVLSGGDYSAFIERKKAEESEVEKEDEDEPFVVPPSLKEIQAATQRNNTPPAPPTDEPEKKLREVL